MSDVRSVLILGVSCLAFYFRMQALYLATIIMVNLESLSKLV